jgi:hypothetical protein
MWLSSPLLFVLTHVLIASTVISTSIPSLVSSVVLVLDMNELKSYRHHVQVLDLALLLVRFFYRDAGDNGSAEVMERIQPIYTSCSIDSNGEDM